MSDFVKLMAIALPLQFALFFLIYHFSKLQGKQVALLVITISLAIYIPFGILSWKGLDQFVYRAAFFITFPYLFGIVTSHWEGSAERGEVHSGKFFHWAPMTMFVFFVCIAIVDSIIISLADKGMSAKFAKRFLPEPQSNAQVVSYFPGAVSHDFQEKEELYNAYLKRREKQQAMGWKVRKGWVSEPLANRPSRFKVAIEGADGQPISDADITGIFLRPGNNALDTHFEMAPDGQGSYLAELTMPAAGRWSVVINIVRGEDRYELRASTSVNEAAVVTP
jgi:nitrogen fixation protein FixH